jgi:hypothetical protein
MDRICIMKPVLSARKTRLARSLPTSELDLTETIMTNRDRYRADDVTREPLEGDDRMGVKPDSQGEARGDARETVGNNARGTDAAPTGPEGNDKTRGRPLPDGFDEDLKRDRKRD